jgi:hypothetical protein
LRWLRIPLLRVNAVTCQIITGPQLLMMCRRVALAVTAFFSMRTIWMMRVGRFVSVGKNMLRVGIIATRGSLVRRPARLT